jgi:hypothetical protein
MQDCSLTEMREYHFFNGSELCVQAQIGCQNEDMSYIYMQLYLYKKSFRIIHRVLPKWKYIEINSEKMGNGWTRL